MRVGGVDHRRSDLADTLVAEVRVQVAVEHGAGLADRGRRPRHGGDREPRLEQLRQRRRRADRLGWRGPRRSGWRGRVRRRRGCRALSRCGSGGGRSRGRCRRTRAAPTMRRRVGGSTPPLPQSRRRPSPRGERSCQSDGQFDGHDGQLTPLSFVALTRRNPSIAGVSCGADDGIRTRDPHLGKVMLYQLSHVRSVLSASRLAGRSVGARRRWTSERTGGSRRQGADRAGAGRRAG